MTVTCCDQCGDQVTRDFKLVKDGMIFPSTGNVGEDLESKVEIICSRCWKVAASAMGVETEERLKPR